MKSNTDIRTAALNWWKNQSEAFKALQFTQYKKENFTPANFHTELTGREIEAIFTDLGLSERAIKESTHITWWKGLNEEEQTKLCQKHFQGIPVESLMERSIKVMFHYENPETTTNTVTGGEGFTKGEWIAHKVSDGWVIKEKGLFEKGYSDRIAKLYQYNTEANANRIVQAVNNHDALVNALRNLLDRMSDEDLIHYAIMEAKQVLNNINQL